jgi:hypothetical protein
MKSFFNLASGSVAAGRSNASEPGGSVPEKEHQKEYLRLPIESARRLRYLDKVVDVGLFARSRKWLKGQAAGYWSKQFQASPETKCVCGCLQSGRPGGAD